MFPGDHAQSSHERIHPWVLTAGEPLCAKDRHEPKAWAVETAYVVTARTAHVDRARETLSRLFKGEQRAASRSKKAISGGGKSQGSWEREARRCFDSGLVGSERGVDSWLLVSGVLAQDASPS